MIHCFIVLVALAWAGLASAADHGVVLLYHHVDTETPPATTVTPSTFRQHLDYLEREQFTVLPLSTLLDKIYSGESLPQNTVAITLDDAYLSAYTEAWPELKRRQLPFTIFVSTQAVDEDYASYVNWSQLAEMGSNLVEFGAHSVSHPHLLMRLADESHDQWLDRAKREMDLSIERLESALSIKVRSFAYPYGEYSRELADHLRGMGMYGLTQHSGAIDASVPAQQLPRFPLSRGYDDLGRFATAVKSRPLPIMNRDMDAELVSLQQAPDSVRLAIGPGEFRTATLGCYSSDGKGLATQWDQGSVIVALPAFIPGRNKINCTAPSNTGGGVYYWYSRLWIVN